MAENTVAVEGRPSISLKHEIVQEIGESSLVLPMLINGGLEANDRGKYFLALIQAARAHADNPDRGFATLREERTAAGVTDEHFDTVIEQSRRLQEASYLVPTIGSIHAELVSSIAEMIAPLEVAGADAGSYAARLKALVDDAPDFADDCVTGTYVNGMASADRRAGDSLHLLIMDAHRSLNQLQLEVATENLDGASVYRLHEDDRSLVSSFMTGVRSTERLKFDHPGLGTTATRSGTRLLIQNDIGMTKAHVIVITVEHFTVTVTYSDVHRSRVAFFESLFEEFSVRWSDAQRQPGGSTVGEYHLVTGRYEADDQKALEEYLCFLGSRLVFLIDWNRARKRIGSVVKNREAIQLLTWAAREGYGHRAFLQMGGERLIYEAAQLTGRVPARYGEPLRDILGADVTLDVMRFALRCASQGLLAGKSQALIRDEVRVELLTHVRAAHQQLIDLVAEHGSLVVETAQSLRAALIRLGMGDDVEYMTRVAARAMTWEHRADEILRAVRMASDRAGGADALVATASSLDDAIDDLEEAMFLLTLLPADAIGVLCPVLEPLAGIAVFAARDQLRALEIARLLIEAAGNDELEDFLLAIDGVVRLEHEADDAERKARAGLVSGSPDFRSLHVADLISCAMENATDGLSHSAYLLRDHVLEQVAVR